MIISHFHSDHWCGNQVFAPGVPILTAHAIREEMPAATGRLNDLKENPAELEQAIRDSPSRLESETDERQRASLERSISRMHQVLADLPTLNLRLPNQTFTRTLVLYGTRRTAKLREVAPGHTADDVYLVLPEDQITFMGDLGFFQCQPFMVFCDPQAWVAQLEDMGGSDSEVFVPGHGPLGTKADIALQKRYILVLQELVAQAYAKGLMPEQALQKLPPAPFDEWLHGGMARREANVRSMYERLSGGSEI